MKRQFPHAVGAMTMQRDSAPLAEAIFAEGRDEETRLKKLRKQIRGLLKSPVVVRGAIISDTCPKHSIINEIPPCSD